MPASLERGGGTVSLPIAQAGIHARKETHVSTGAEALACPEGLADAFSNPIAKALADPKVLPNSEILPDSEVLPDPQTHSGAET